MASATTHDERAPKRPAPWSTSAPQKRAQSYYDATTWIYRWAWGSSLHFAPLTPSRSRRDAIAQYEAQLAGELGITAGMLCLDLGCGIGGPARTIAASTAAHIVGINSNIAQLGVLRRSSIGRTVGGIAAYFEHLPFAEAQVDRAYAFEALCHSVDLKATLREVYRVLRPGGRLGFSEWCLTDGYDERREADCSLRRVIESSYGVVALRSWPQWQAALIDAGFRVEKCVDQAQQGGEPWYSALEQRDRSFDSLVRSPSMRAVQAMILGLGESCRLLPQGTSATVEHLRAGTVALLEAGKRGIFTPMMFVIASK